MNESEYQEHIEKLLRNIVSKHDSNETVTPEWVNANIVPNMPANKDVELLCEQLGIILNPPKQRRFTFLRPSDVKRREPPKWLIKDLLIEKSFTIIYAQSRSFKSYIALNILGHLATGGEFSPGERLPQMGVLNIVLEGAFGMGSRMQAWEIHNDTIIADGFYVQLEDPLNFSDEELVDTLFSEIRELIDSGFPLGHINIDTAAKALGGLDGMNQRDVIAFCAVCSRMVQAFGVGVTLVHHTGKNEQGGVIGSNSWLTEPDCVLWISRPRKDLPNVTITVEKQKYGPDQQEHKFIAHKIDLGEAGAGGVGSDLVVVPDLEAPSVAAQQAAEKDRADLLHIARIMVPGEKKSIGAFRLVSAKAHGPFANNGRGSDRIKYLLSEERHVRLSTTESRRLWIDDAGKICCELGQIEEMKENV